MQKLLILINYSFELTITVTIIRITLRVTDKFSETEITVHDQNYSCNYCKARF